MRVVVDSSALIPLSRVGHLDLIDCTFDDILTTEGVAEEVLTGGNRGAANIHAMWDDVVVKQTLDAAEDRAEIEGISTVDACVTIWAEEVDAVLLANDKSLIEAARSHNVECWWVTTLLLKCTKERQLRSDEAKEILYDLVDEGMNLSPQIYSKVQKKFEEIDDRQ